MTENPNWYSLIRHTVRLPKVKTTKTSGLDPCGVSYGQMMAYLKSL